MKEPLYRPINLRVEAAVHRNRVLIVEDEAKIAQVIESYLNNGGYITRIAQNGEQALELFSSFNPDLILLDLMLPGISGERVCEQIRKTSQLPIIILSAKNDEENIIQGLGIGADDYIVKPFSPRQLMARIESVLRRTQSQMHTEGVVIDKEKRIVMVDGNNVNLTPIEYKLLLSFVSYPLKVFTRDELLSTLFGGDYDVFDRTIDTHIKNLRYKIEKDSKNPQMILTAHGVGYKYGGKNL